MNTIKKISALLLTSILAFSAVSCGDEDGSKSSSDNSKPYEKPINNFMTSIQKKDPDKLIEAFGGDLKYEICEAQFEYNEDYFKDQGYNNVKESLYEGSEEYIEEIYEDTNGGNFKYKIEDADRLSKSELESKAKEFAYDEQLDEIDFEYKVEDGYLVEVSIEYDDEKDYQVFYVLKVNGTWCMMRF